MLHVKPRPEVCVTKTFSFLMRDETSTIEESLTEIMYKSASASVSVEKEWKIVPKFSEVR